MIISKHRWELNLLRKSLLVCGILSSLLYIGMNIFIPMRFEGYDSASQTVSELSAIGAPTRQLWVSLCIVYTLLATAFGWGVLQSANQNRRLRLVGGLLMAYGFLGLFWPPMHMRGTEKSLTDTMHIIFAVVTVILMMLIIGFGASSLGKRFRLYSIATMLVLIVFGILTGLDGPRVAANLPTPWAGVWERINIGVFLLWIIVLAIVLLRADMQASKKNIKQVDDREMLYLF